MTLDCIGKHKESHGIPLESKCVPTPCVDGAAEPMLRAAGGECWEPCYFRGIQRIPKNRKIFLILDFFGTGPDAENTLISTVLAAFLSGPASWIFFGRS